MWRGLNSPETTLTFDFRLRLKPQTVQLFR
jgi:hypothetical protein